MYIHGKKVQTLSTWETLPVMRERIYNVAVVAVKNSMGHWYVAGIITMVMVVVTLLDKVIHPSDKQKNLWESNQTLCVISVTFQSRAVSDKIS